MQFQVLVVELGVLGFGAYVFVGSHSLQYTDIHIRAWSSKILTAINVPLKGADE
jgi:hypothetical protein